MTARPIRHKAQVPDRNGKIFYTSITSLSHISKVPGNEAAYGWRRCSTYRNHTCTITFRLILNQVWIMGQGNPCPGGKEEIIEQHNSADY